MFSERVFLRNYKKLVSWSTFTRCKIIHNQNEISLVIHRSVRFNDFIWNFFFLWTSKNSHNLLKLCSENFYINCTFLRDTKLRNYRTRKPLKDTYRKYLISISSFVLFKPDKKYHLLNVPVWYVRTSTVLFEYLFDICLIWYLFDIYEYLFDMSVPLLYYNLKSLGGKMKTEPWLLHSVSQSRYLTPPVQFIRDVIENVNFIFLKSLD